MVEGQFAGSDSVAVAVSGAWTATSDAFWLHTTSSGTGKGLVANPRRDRRPQRDDVIKLQTNVINNETVFVSIPAFPFGGASNRNDSAEGLLK